MNSVYILTMKRGSYDTQNKEDLENNMSEHQDTMFYPNQNVKKDVTKLLRFSNDIHLYRLNFLKSTGSVIMYIM